MKQNLLVKQLLVIVFALVGSVSVWGTDVTLTTADYTWTATDKHVSQTVSGVTFDFNGGSTAPTYYAANGLRTYEGCVITISSTSTITSIVYTYTINNSGCLKSATTGTWNESTKTWSGTATSIGLTVGHSSGTSNGQVRITSIVVTTTGSTKTSISPTLSYTSTTLTAGGANSSNPTVTGNTGNGTCSYSLENVSPAGCATINASTGVITPVSAGTATAKVTIAETTNYQSGTATCAITINAAPAVKYNVTWTVEGNKYTTGSPTSEVTSGNKVTILPTAPTSSCEGTFAGWVKSDNTVVGQKPSNEYATDPTPFTTAAESPAITGDTEFVAVFKKEL